MKRTLLLVLLLLAANRGNAVEDLTADPVNLSLTYIPFSVSMNGTFMTITLPGAPDLWIVTLPSNGIFYPFSGGAPIGAQEQVSDPQGRITYALYDDVDTVVSFVYSIGAPNTQGCRYGLCSIRLNSTNIAGDPGAFDVFLTDAVSGAKIGGAAVNMTNIPNPPISLTEVGIGQYRGIVFNNDPRNFAATRSGYDARLFSATPNAGTYGSIAQTMIDPTPGAVNVSTTASNPTAANPIPFRIFFSKQVNPGLGDFTSADVTVTNGTVSSLDGGPDDYTAQVIPNAAGAVQVSVAAGVARDGANIPNAASNTLSVTYDAVSPTVTINQAVAQADPATSYPVRFEVVFSEAVTGFAIDDLEFSGSATGPIIPTIIGSGSHYTVEATGMSGPGTIIATVRADAATGASGPSRESTSSDNVVTWAPPANYTLPTIVQRLNYTTASIPPSETIEFNLDPTDANGADTDAWVVLPPRSAQTRLMQTSGSVITAADTAVSNTDKGRVRVGVNNFSGDTSDFFVYSLTPPGTPGRTFGFVHLTLVNNSDLSLTIGGAFVSLKDAGGLPIRGATVTYGATADGGTAFTEVSAGLYRLTISNNTSGTIFVRAAGFQDESQAQALSVGNFPEFPFVLEPGSLLAGITSPVADTTRAKSFPVTFTFSSAVSGFSAADVKVSNGTFSGFAGSGGTYTGTVTCRRAGTVKVEIPSGAATAGAFSNNAAALTRLYDPRGPLVTINQAAGQADPVVAGPILFTAQFSSPVTGFTGADIGFAGSTATGTLAATVTGSGQTYTVSVSGMVGDGTVVPSITVDAALANGHPSAASTSSDNSVTFTPPGVGSPSVTIDQDAGQPDPTPLNAVIFRVRFSDPVNGFIANDVQLSGTAPGTLTRSLSMVGSDSTEFLLLVGGMTGAGTVVATLPAGAATAQAGGAPTFAATSSDNQVTYAPAGGSGGGPSAASGSGTCGLGSGLAALLIGGGLVLLGRRQLR